MAQATRAVEVGEAPAWQSLCLVRGAGGSSDAPLSLAVAAECPDQSPELQPWSPGHDPGHRVHIGRGRTLLLTSSATVNSIHVSEGGKLVIKDQDEAIVLRTRHILVDNGGELHAGSALCPYQGNFSIVLYGRWAVSFRGSNAPLGSDGKEAFQRREGGGMAGRGPWSQPAGRNHEQHRRGPLGRAGGGVVFLVGPRRGDARPCQTSGCLSVTSRLREPLGVFIQRVRMDTIKQISTQCQPLAN